MGCPGPSFSFIFFHFLSFSFIFVSFSFIFFHFPSFSFIFFHFCVFHFLSFCCLRYDCVYLCSLLPSMIDIAVSLVLQSMPPVGRATRLTASNLLRNTKFCAFQKGKKKARKNAWKSDPAHDLHNTKQEEQEVVRSLFWSLTKRASDHLSEAFCSSYPKLLSEASVWSLFGLSWDDHLDLWSLPCITWHALIIMLLLCF